MCVLYSHIETLCFNVWIPLLRKKTNIKNTCILWSHRSKLVSLWMIKILILILTRYQQLLFTTTIEIKFSSWYAKFFMSKTNIMNTSNANLRFKHNNDKTMSIILTNWKDSISLFLYVAPFLWCKSLLRDYIWQVKQNKLTKMV